MFENNDTIEESMEEDLSGSGSWNYELSWLEDNMYLPVYKISRQLDKITNMVVANPHFKEKESEIPFSLELSENLRFLSQTRKITQYQGWCVFQICFFKNEVRFHPAIFVLICLTSK